MPRRILVLTFALMLVMQCGCAFLATVDGDNYADIDASGGLQRSGMGSLPPQTKPDGQPYTLAYADIDPYPITGEILYYIVMGLRDEGWITFDTLPFDPEDTDAGALIDWLASRDIGPYIRFDSSANYYLAYQSEEEIFESLSRHVESGFIDLVMTMGTWPSAMIKSFELDVPVMMFGAANPIGSGLVDSLEDSGNPNVWAVFDPTSFERQLLYYYDCVPFTNLGILYYDESIANVDSYKRAADMLGIEVTERAVDRIDLTEEHLAAQYYDDLKAHFERLVIRDGIDAFMLTTDIIVDADRTEELLEVFTANGVPVFVQTGEVFVEQGALMNVSALEMEGLGIFSARSITQALTGTPLAELPQEYRNSPFLVMNLDVAERIGYRPTFETLLACERVYTSES